MLHSPSCRCAPRSAGSHPESHDSFGTSFGAQYYVDLHSIFMPNGDDDTGAAQFTVSASGHLAFALGGIYPARRSTVVRVGRDGEIEPLDPDREAFSSFRVSPVGNRLAYTIGMGRLSEVWVQDLDRGTDQRLITGGFADWAVAWSPDGRSLAFSSDRDQALPNIYSLPAGGGGEPERLAPSDRIQLMASWSSEGVIAWLEAGDIWVLPPDGAPAPFFTSEASEAYATFSPDGHWLAYVGGGGIYVRPYPGPEPATLISDGGVAPAWSPDGRELYFRRDGVLWAVDVTLGDEFQAGRSVPLIDPWTGGGTSSVRTYDVFADGSFVKRVLDYDESEAGEDPESEDPESIAARELEQFGATELHVVINWFEELKVRVPN